MKTLFFEISMWLGVASILLALLFILWASQKVIDKISMHSRFLNIMYEFAFYRKDFEEYMEKTGKARNPRLKKFVKPTNSK